MKRFALIVLVVYVAVSLLYATTTLLMLRHNLGDTENCFQYSYLTNHPSDVKTLIIGHSHATCSFDVDNLDSTFNLGYFARISYYDAQILRHFASRLPRLQTVIYTLAYEYEPGRFFLDEAFRKDQLFFYQWYYHVEPPEEYNTLSNQLYMIRRIFNYKNLRKHNTGEAHPREDIIGNADGVWCAPNVKSHTYASIMQMAEICHQNGVRLIVVTCPGNSTYMSQSVDSSGIADLYGMIDSVGEHYPIEYHCYLGDPDFCNDSLFADQTHLNKRGAKLFTDRMKTDWGLR